MKYNIRMYFDNWSWWLYYNPSSSLENAQIFIIQRQQNFIWGVSLILNYLHVFFIKTIKIKERFHDVTNLMFL